MGGIFLYPQSQRAPTADNRRIQSLLDDDEDDLPDWKESDAL